MAGLTNVTIITEALELTGASLIQDVAAIPQIAKLGPAVYNEFVIAGQVAYADAYRYVYFVSIGTFFCLMDDSLLTCSALAFGAVSIIAAVFLGDISQYMDDHVAVVIH